jgi:D-glycero-D-manno-heptose 1,7-bisphosphate phosphatase
MRAAVFLDRDGTMVHDVGYLSRREDLAWFPWTVDAIRILNRAGFLVLVTTNQGGIGLGYLTEAFLRGLHDEMQGVLEAAGARVDGWFFCPHHPQAATEELRIACACRKPRPGMIHQAMERFEIDLGRSYVVGDTVKDMQLAHEVGARGVLVRTGQGELQLVRKAQELPASVHVSASLLDAASWILREGGHPKEPV